MKKLIVILIFIFIASDGFSQIGIGIGSRGFGMGMNIPINSRKNSQRNNRLESQVKDMKHDLDLNDDQVIKVRSLLIDRDKKRQRGDKMSNEDFDKRMQGILTPDQYSKYNELKQQKREERREEKKDNKKEKEKAPESEWDDVYR